MKEKDDENASKGKTKTICNLELKLCGRWVDKVPIVFPLGNFLVNEVLFTNHLILRAVPNFQDPAGFNQFRLKKPGQNNPGF